MKKIITIALGLVSTLAPCAASTMAWGANPMQDDSVEWSINPLDSQNALDIEKLLQKRANLIESMEHTHRYIQRLIGEQNLIRASINAVQNAIASGANHTLRLQSRELKLRVNQQQLEDAYEVDFEQQEALEGLNKLINESNGGCTIDAVQPFKTEVINLYGKFGPSSAAHCVTPSRTMKRPSGSPVSPDLPGSPSKKGRR